MVFDVCRIGFETYRLIDIAAPISGLVADCWLGNVRCHLANRRGTKGLHAETVVAESAVGCRIPIDSALTFT